MEVFYVFLATQGSLIITIFRTRKKILPKLVYVLLLVHLVSKLMHIIPPPSLSLYGGCAVEPLKTDTPLDKLKCPSYRGVRLIEASQTFHVISYVTLQIPLFYVICSDCMYTVIEMGLQINHS